MMKKMVVVEWFHFRSLVKCKYNDASKAEQYATNFCNPVEPLQVQSLHPARQNEEYPKFNLVYIFKLSKETTDNNHVFFGILQLVRGFSY